MQHGVTEELYAHVAQYRESDLYSAGEKVALEYAERFAEDHLSITDELFDRLRAHFDDGEILDLSVAIARFLAFGRLTQVLRLGIECPIT